MEKYFSLLGVGKQKHPEETKNMNHKKGWYIKLY